MILKLRIKNSWVYIDRIKECQVYPVKYEDIKHLGGTKRDYQLYKIQ
jgi:hypothetical protein